MDLPQQSEPLDAWLNRMQFSSPTDGRRSGLTPLRFAVLARRGDLASELIAAGADVEAPLADGHPSFDFIRGETILYRLCRFRDAPELVSLLLDAGADPTRHDKEVGATPLHTALAGGHAGNIRVLMERCGGAMLRSVTAFGDLPVGIAALFGRKDGIQCYLRDAAPEQREAVFASLQSVDGFGACLLTVNLSLGVGDVETLDFCISQGCDVNRRTPRALCSSSSTAATPPLMLISRTVCLVSDWLSRPPPFFELFDNMPGAAPLHFAALTGNLGAVDLLLTRRADPDLQNARGRTALALAAMAGHNDVVLRLRAAGARDIEADGKGGGEDRRRCWLRCVPSKEETAQLGEHSATLR